MEGSLAHDLDEGASGASDIHNEELAIIEVDSSMLPRDTFFQDDYLVGGVPADVSSFLLQGVEDTLRTVDLLDDQLNSLLFRIILVGWTWFFERCKLLLLLKN